MPKKPYMPQTDDGIDKMLIAFDTNINASNGKLAAKYGLDAQDLARITQATLVWGWFAAALIIARNWAQGLTLTRDSMQTGPAGALAALPGLPELPEVPKLPGSQPPVLVMLDPDFFTFFSSIVAQIKNAANYDPADGVLLGIEGADIPAPDEGIVPVVTGALRTGGHPELTCAKGQFQGFIAWLTRPGQPKKQIGFSTSRHYNVTEPLPAPGTAEVWTFEVQYQYQDAPFGQISQPLNLTVRG